MYTYIRFEDFDFICFFQTAKSNLNNLDPSEEMKMAGLDFVKCPVCSSAAINEFNTLIICQNSACAKESCNLCKKESHLPWPCEQIFDLNNVSFDIQTNDLYVLNWATDLGFFKESFMIFSSRHQRKQQHRI